MSHTHLNFLQVIRTGLEMTSNYFLRRFALVLLWSIYHVYKGTVTAGAHMTTSCLGSMYE